MDELAKRFADLAEKYGPSVADAAKSAAQVEAYSTLVSGALCLVFASVALYLSALLARKALKSNWDEITWLPVGLLGVGGAISLAIGLWCFVDPWTWTAIAHPELWLAKKAFHI